MRYFIVRVNTSDHNDRPTAIDDMAAIIDKRGYWRKSVRSDMPIGSAMIAVGGHGGRGLFLHGVVRKDWKDVSGSGGAEGNKVYTNKLGVEWQRVVYMLAPSAVEQVLTMAGVGGTPPVLISNTEINKLQYRTILHTVLLGEAINPWNHNDYKADAA
jgi:hypothetical protein